LSTALLFWGLLFGAIGLGFFVYGRRQKAVVPLVCGLTLMVFPYFITNTILLVAIGVALTVLPYFIRI
jgi:predicted membrane protein